MRNKTKLVHGIGINDYEGSCKENSKNIKSYEVWTSMLNRCYGEKYQIKQPTYIGCSVCKEWSYFSNFKIWFDENYREGFHLDKDILIECNKLYSPDTCRFVPQYLNSLLVDRKNHRGNLPLGVSLKMTKRQITPTYTGWCNNQNGKRLSKTFKTVQEAQAWYSTTKTRIVKEQAIRAFMEGAIKTDVYLALVRRKF